ncbi:hypothetical protein O6H91_09G030100 [Diphasiastrum complanatum]|uniref:Uncharacterized protein n=3 Tax=Diphasiastrum complanatum TaxID=34168 RepID=A0ACC2CMP1_DIPCM|nr:hypothetical protein O6H91_09G029800 [Diphasiastrum complanatum]KAJ7543219.1 hypothetical protein O6H91_09G029800 [Diphasiastrum complanatum]KAJ7543232.1 hypothetical protein O6H91_09G030100 [Diphasiastrum complanatum]
MANMKWEDPFWKSVCSASFLLLSFVIGVKGGVLFSTLPKTLNVVVFTGPHNDSSHVVKAGVDHLFVSWVLNESVAAGVDASYKTVKTKLCFAPVSQVDRKWRKTFDDLHKDKTCSFGISSQPYKAAGNQTIWLIPKKVPFAIYFVRAYALNATGMEVAFGQSTDRNITHNLFQVEPISGRHASLDIAAACFSAASILSLVAFFIIEKLMMRRQKDL